ncbi:MAG: prepilin peptidase [Ardenticatenaceae bacterium]|nr:prepilin peptidase [Ardenticatenaceae bacterium]MCB9442693.1 prepilin peptidase [Ardenticatenaceae bacterium]
MQNGEQQGKQKRPLAVIAFAITLISVTADLLSLITVNVELVRERVTAAYTFLFKQPLTTSPTASSFFTSFNDLWPVHLVFLVFLATITYYEIKEKRIPDAVTYPGMVLGAAFAIGFPQINLALSLYGLAFGLGINYLGNLYYKRLTGVPGIGWGAIKMQGMIGAFLGLPVLMLTIILAGFIHGLYGASYAVVKRDISYMRREIEFGPTLAIASVIAVMILSIWPVDFGL